MKDLKMDMLQQRLNLLEFEKQRTTAQFSSSVDRNFPGIDNLNVIDAEPSRHAIGAINKRKRKCNASQEVETSQYRVEAPKGRQDACGVGTLEGSNLENSAVGRHISVARSSYARSGASTSAFALADQPCGTQSPTQTPQVTKGPESTKVPEQPDRLLSCLEDANRISSELRFETLELLDIRQMGRRYDSNHLRLKYDQAQHVFENLWIQEIRSLKPGYLARTSNLELDTPVPEMPPKLSPMASGSSVLLGHRSFRLLPASSGPRCRVSSPAPHRLEGMKGEEFDFSGYNSLEAALDSPPEQIHEYYFGQDDADADVEEFELPSPPIQGHHSRRGSIYAAATTSRDDDDDLEAHMIAAMDEGDDAPTLYAPRPAESDEAGEECSEERMKGQVVDFGDEDDELTAISDEDEAPLLRTEM